MWIGLLSKLAGFSLRNPKIILFGIIAVVLLSLGAHYKIILAKNKRLETEQEAYAAAVKAFEVRETALQEDIRREREAAATAAAERNEARRALETFRAGREDDPESIEWAATPIPPGELARICAALPRLEGCE